MDLKEMYGLKALTEKAFPAAFSEKVVDDTMTSKDDLRVHWRRNPHLRFQLFF